MGNRMKVLYSLLALLCIVSTVCSDKSLGNFNGPVHGGTFNQESQKTDITANLNHGSFTGGTFIGKRAWKNRSKGKKIVMNERTVKRENLISGDFNGPVFGGTFNGKRDKSLGNFNGPVHGGTFNQESQKTDITANLNHGSFTGGTFIGKRDNKHGTNSSEVVDNKKKDKRQNIISGAMSGVFNGGNFNGKRQNIISGDLTGTFNAPNLSGKRDNKQGTNSSEVVDNKKKDKRQNISSGSMPGVFNGG